MMCTSTLGSSSPAFTVGRLPMFMTILWMPLSSGPPPAGGDTWAQLR